MQRLKSISLLLILVVIIFPWRMICIAHPLGHTHHHEPGKLSPCELRKQYKGKGPAYFPPMHCHNISGDVENYQLPVKFQIKLQQPVIVFNIAQFDPTQSLFSERLYCPTPEPRCRSAPCISSNTLRGPPYC